MPAIRKIRIVNFRFNDGAKLIPDEIFCTENAEGKPIDTLLNLDNGGGKSVIVQLLLQPVCPKAKVQNRNISDYFQKGTDHAFVLIEWALDGSTNSLLTGIALAASTTADDENENKTVRFYTFIHDYTRSGDKLDMINLPLTERTGSHIRPMSFDDLRKYLQNKKVEYYPSDSLRRYQKRLEEYGILHTEWENILVRINAVEGGITKFFEEYKTADRLLDKFIIPGVTTNDTASTEELEEMFVNYADSYAKQEENLLLQSQIKVFTEKLQDILPFMKNMWNAEDARIQAIHLLADHWFTLNHHIKVESEKQAQIEQKITNLKAQLHHIKAEKASETYYLAQESFDKASAELEEYRQQKEDAKNQLDNFAHKISVLNAAKEYAELLELQNDEKALNAQIRELEQGTQDSRILSLKYSLSLKAAELSQQTESNLHQENSARKEQSDALCKANKNIAQLSTQLKERKARLDQTIGSKNTMLVQIDKGLSELDLDITVMLDGSYSKEDIEIIRSGYDKEIKNANDKIESYRNEAEQLEMELEDQDTERTELTQEQANYNANLQQQQAAMEQYRNAYNAVLPVLEHLSISASRLFTDEPITSLDNILANLTERQRQTERSAELLAEQLRCIEAGQLHLSKTAVDFLQESGIGFQTGEQYLIRQSPELREKILAVNPLVAYAVIVDSEKDQTKLLSQTPDLWLSAVVPVYSLSEIADMADGNWSKHNSFLSSFDKEYFSDVFAYKDLKQQGLDDVKAKIEHFKSQIREWQSERSILTEFKYTADYEQRIQEQINSCHSELQTIEDTLSALDNRKTEIKKRTKELQALIKAEQHVLRQTENQQKEFERICDTISQYEELSGQIIDMESACERLSAQIKSAEREERRISELIAEFDEKIKHLNDMLTEYQNLLDELKDTPEADILSEDFSAMLTEYRMYQENYSADRTKLEKQLQKAQEGIKKKAKDIGRFHIEPSEYESATYSDDVYRRTEEQQSQAQKEYNQVSEQYSAAVECHAKAESALVQAKDKLSELQAEPLPRSEVGSDFEKRIEGCNSALKDSEKVKQECTNKLIELNAKCIYTSEYAKHFSVECADYKPKLLDVLKNTDELRDTIENCIKQLDQAKSNTKKYLSIELEPFRNTHTSFTGTLDGILSVIDAHSTTGDKYFTLYERTEGDIRRYKDCIKQLDVLLKDVEDSRKQLVEHCRQRVVRLYDNLKTLSLKSNIQIGKATKQMIRIDLPDIEPMSEQPAERINQYITEQVKKYLSEQDNSAKPLHEHLAIRRLLNCYIGKESIPITVYKIDKNIQNSCYRSWQDALKANSGGEQFVVLFSLIISVMNYTRGLTSNLRTTSGVLILDNPFGPISSPHLLEPMFRIARHFHIQLICLTHLGTAAVTSFFDMVYQLRFKNLPLSNVEILESEAKQHMEHAYYLSEQFSLL